LLSLKKITELAHQMADLVLEKGDRAIDATAGNGNDTVFLAQKVGPSGHVYAFDIQEAALAKVREKLQGKGLTEQVTLLNRSHDKISGLVAGPVSIVMYNLGYLPGGSREVTTEAVSVLNSLRQALAMLKPGGLVTIVLYPGHVQGRREKELILPYCKGLQASDFSVLHLELINQASFPPELLVIQKLLFPAK
jgi:predicted methyltransferase